MVNEKELLKAYLKLFLTKWYSLVSIALNILGLIGLFYSPSKVVLSIIVVIASFFGIISSGYFVYRDLFKIIPKEYSLSYLPPKIGKPEIQIYQIGGKEYSYRFPDFDTPDLKKHFLDDCVLPILYCHFYFTIKNVGYIPINILNIYGNVDVITPFHFMVPKALETDEKPIQFPISLDHGKEKEIILSVNVQPFQSFTDAKMAVEIKKSISLKKIESITVEIEIAALNGESMFFKKAFSFSTEMLFKIYINHWRSLNKGKLLDLVGEK
ncbi:MAG: hypothetical protein JXB49_07950 [Bacteroidales bacterium]|nr:hypothetical protein [Bacteroidales bacterium]